MSAGRKPKFTAAVAKAIREAAAGGDHYTTIMLNFGLSYNTLRKIIRKQYKGR